ncbi:unnamed protein product [Camellia sinensis]
MPSHRSLYFAPLLIKPKSKTNKTQITLVFPGEDGEKREREREEVEGDEVGRPELSHSPLPSFRQGM